MDAETIQEIVGLVESRRPKAEHLTMDPAHVMRIIGHGTAQVSVAEPAPRVHQVMTVESFVQAVKRWGADKSPVWVGAERLIAVLNDADDRRARIVMKLTPTEAWASLKTLGGCSLAQRGLVDFLRIKLAGCVELDLINLFRNLKASSSSETEAKLQVGRESLGRQVNRQASAAGGDIPEEITVRTALFEEFAAEQYDIRCAVVTNLEDLTFNVLPLAGQMTEALRELLGTVVQGLKVALGHDDVFMGEV